MPTYNSAEFLPYSIRSILTQSFVDFEFLIIDDGSTDNTEEIVSSFSDSRINYIKKVHSGLADTLNYGLKTAHFDLVARMDADDISHHQRLEKQLNFIKTNPKIDVVSSWYSVIEKARIKYVVKTPIFHDDIVHGLLLYSYICHSACIYDKRTILLYNGYQEDAFEDYKLWLKIMHDVKFANIPEVLQFVNYNKKSLSRNNLIQKSEHHYELQKKYYASLSKYFQIENFFEEAKCRGWREYFYGDKRLARKYWNSNFIQFREWKVLIAYIITFLPQSFFIRWKELNFRYKLNYLITFFSSENRRFRKTLKELITQLNYYFS